ncbi:dual specificity mitogen-activated protein kinase kinase 4 isoform X2 [Panulirus ornatus]|uniref:dual specificity mitogen-activated protein kinase kinase 4 isoform X2 n=1 Tax=Panulirus ornatus TaxID=150431 RepID=UPI003A870759
MAEQPQQTGHNNRPGSLNMSAAAPGRRSNLRLAFPAQGRPTNDRPHNKLEFPASGYPTTQMPPPPPVPPLPKIVVSNRANAQVATCISSSESSTVSSPSSSRSGNTATATSSTAPVTVTVSPGLPPSTAVNPSSGGPQNLREHKKKHLVLHLPPPHHHHHHHHHNNHHASHNQHHRHMIHHDVHRDRSHKRDRITRGIYQSIQSSGKLKISPELQVEFTADDLRDLGEIGRGGFGTVNKMVHRKSNTIMAVKRIRSTVDEREQKQLLMDLEVVMRSNDCPCIVQFYGAIFKEGDCWICMELMDTSLDKFYKFIYEQMHERLPENMLGKITVATLTALNYLKEKLKIIHRDVKPSNILLDKRGNIKLCDFGISGQLVDSIAKTRDAGCRPYMAPERIDPARARGYDVRSDVWSLGITLMELATGSFPYPKWNSVFEQLTQVVQGEPPRLSPNENGNTFSEEFVCFVNTCLIKDEISRPKYKQLLEHEFVIRSRADPMDVAEFVCGILDKMANNGRAMYTYDSYNC